MEKILLDTNMFIYLEDYAVTEKKVATLTKMLFDSEQYKIVIHPKTKEEILKIADDEKRDIFLSKISVYKEIKSAPKVTEEFNEQVGCKNNHDAIDNELLFSIYRNCAQYLITNDKDLVKKSQKVGLGNRVLSIDQALEKFQEKVPEDIRKPVFINHKYLHELDINDAFFDSLKLDYAGFEEWFKNKQSKEARAYVTELDGKLTSFLMLKVENEELVNTIKDKIEIIDGILNGLNYNNFDSLNNTDKYNLIKEGANVVLCSEDRKKRFMKHSLDVKNLYTLCNGILEKKYKNKVLYIISVRSFISKISNDNKLDVSEINKTVGKMLEESLKEDELINLGELSRGNSLELLSDAMLSKLRGLKDKNIAAEILSRAIKATINDIGKVNLTLQEKFSTRFNKLVDAYNERTDLADIEKVIEELIKLKYEIQEELDKGNEYNLSIEEKAFFDALGADPEIKELMKDETLVQIAKELVEIINENLTLDAFKREDARARIRVNIRKLLIKYNYPPIKRETAVEKVIRQAELKYSSEDN